MMMKFGKIYFKLKNLILKIEKIWKKIKNWIDLDLIDHGESKNFGPDTLGSILRTKGPKNLKKGQNFKVIFSVSDRKVYHTIPLPFPLPFPVPDSLVLFSTKEY